MDKLDELVEELRFKNIIDALKTVNFKSEETELIAQVIRKKTLQNAIDILEKDPSLNKEVNKTR